MQQCTVHNAPPKNRRGSALTKIKYVDACNPSPGGIAEHGRAVLLWKKWVRGTPTSAAQQPSQPAPPAAHPRFFSAQNLTLQTKSTLRNHDVCLSQDNDSKVRKCRSIARSRTAGQPFPCHTSWLSVEHFSHLKDREAACPAINKVSEMAVVCALL